MSNLSFYYQPTLFLIGFAQNQQHFICTDENDEEYQDDSHFYCHEDGVKKSDIDQCKWIYTPNGHKITLDRDEDNYRDIRQSRLGLCRC